MPMPTLYVSVASVTVFHTIHADWANPRFWSSFCASPASLSSATASLPAASLASRSCSFRALCEDPPSSLAIWSWSFRLVSCRDCVASSAASCTASSSRANFSAALAASLRLAHDLGDYLDEGDGAEDRERRRHQLADRADAGEHHGHGAGHVYAYLLAEEHDAVAGLHHGVAYLFAGLAPPSTMRSLALLMASAAWLPRLGPAGVNLGSYSEYVVRHCASPGSASGCLVCSPVVCFPRPPRQRKRTSRPRPRGRPAPRGT